MNKRPSFWEVAKDLGSYIGGWILLFKQAGIFFAPPAQISEIWITIGVVAIGIPGLSQLWLARFGKGTSTDVQLPQPPSPDSSPSSSGAH